jgi:mercuric ion transport protein
MNDTNAQATLGADNTVLGEGDAKDQTGLAATGGILGAIAASACCLLPLVLTILGVGGAWMSSLRALNAYQPYFIALAVTALGYGFYQIYWKPRKACVDGVACARPLPRRLVKTGLWSGALLVTLVLLFPYLFPVIEPYLP